MIVPHPNLSANAIPRSGSTCAQCENTIDPRRSRRAAGQFVFSPRLLWSGRIHSRAGVSASAFLDFVDASWQRPRAQGLRPTLRG
jgi:hypothetical protein